MPPALRCRTRSEWPDRSTCSSVRRVDGSPGRPTNARPLGPDRKSINGVGFTAPVAAAVRVGASCFTPESSRTRRGAARPGARRPGASRPRTPGVVRAGAPGGLAVVPVAEDPVAPERGREVEDEAPGDVVLVDEPGAGSDRVLKVGALQSQRVGGPQGDRQ